jgi:hypothetical protein
LARKHRPPTTIHESFSIHGIHSGVNKSRLTNITAQSSHTGVLGRVKHKGLPQ